MSQIEINNSAKSELENIINELFLLKLDSKLKDNIACFDKKTDSDRKAISRNINDFKEEFQNKSNELPRLIKKVSSEIKTQSEENKQFTNDGLDSIQIMLSEIQDIILNNILSEISKKFNKQEYDNEELNLKLNHVINSQTKEIISSHLDNQVVLKNLHLELSSEIFELVKKNRLKEQKEFLDLKKSICDYVFSKNKNDLNLQNYLNNNFKKVEQLNYALSIDVEEKLKLIRIENQNQISKVLNKINIGFISLLFLNIFILILFIYIHLL